MSESRQYELVYVVSPEVGEDGVKDLHTQVEAIVSGLGGRIAKTDNWGRRRLAYEIGRHKEGTYVVNLVEGPGELVRELNRKLKVMDQVLRYLVVRVDEDLRKADQARLKRQTRQARRRAARGMPPARTAASVPDTPATEPSAAVATSPDVTPEGAASEKAAEKAEVDK